MKNFTNFMLYLVSFIILNTASVYAQARSEYGEPLCTYVGEKGFRIVSFCENWSSQERLEEVYYELLNNFYAEEINSLEGIYIYPNSPEGTSGYYFEASLEVENGRLKYGNDAYIEVFNADEYNHISQMAWVLSHEYGHHFTFYYLINYENRYYNDWDKTEYAAIRNLKAYPQVDYGTGGRVDYSHKWDITEIAAEDYVQLFGSRYAKESVDYLDVSERLEMNVSEYYYSTNSYNLYPQENLELPLAAEVDGLYSYWLNMAGYTSISPSISKKPIPKITEVERVYFKENKKYKLVWDELKDSNQYEYTVIMYPTGMPYLPTPVKTLVTGEEMVAYIGSDVRLNVDNPVGILEKFEGEYEIRVFIKDRGGFMFSSETLFYDFTNEINRYEFFHEAPYNIKDNFLQYVEEEKFINNAEYDKFKTEAGGEIIKAEMIRDFDIRSYKFESTENISKEQNEAKKHNTNENYPALNGKPYNSAQKRELKTDYKKIAEKTLNGLYKLIYKINRFPNIVRNKI